MRAYFEVDSDVYTVLKSYPKESLLSMINDPLRSPLNRCAWFCVFVDTRLLRIDGKAPIVDYVDIMNTSMHETAAFMHLRLPLEDVGLTTETLTMLHVEAPYYRHFDWMLDPTISADLLLTRDRFTDELLESCGVFAKGAPKDLSYVYTEAVEKGLEEKRQRVSKMTEEEAEAYNRLTKQLTKRRAKGK